MTDTLASLVPAAPHLRMQEEVFDDLKATCQEHASVATFVELGKSEEGRPLCGIVLGTGPRTVSLIAGAHADEPVGPETLRTLITEGLREYALLALLLEDFRFVIVPHINPDGEARNRAWTATWPDLGSYLRHVVRELPGRDLEFGFPALRIENRLVAGFLRRYAPYSLHMSLHSMGFSEGAMLLIERHWSFRTQELQEGFASAALRAGLPLHDHNRKGEKGFFYLGPGFNTTPEGEAMRTFFRAQGDEVLAGYFHQSSMEFVRSLGGDPLCLVTELPIFLLAGEQTQPGVPATYLALREYIGTHNVRTISEESVAEFAKLFRIQPFRLGTALALQFTAIELGLDAVRAS